MKKMNLVMKPSALLKRALKFATDKHQGQLRKYTNEPYINHPKAVSSIVAKVTKDEEILAAALLHGIKKV